MNYFNWDKTRLGLTAVHFLITRNNVERVFLMRICRNECEMKVLKKLNIFSIGAKENKLWFTLSASDHSELVIISLIIKEMYFNIN